MAAESRTFHRTAGVEEAPLQDELMLFDPASGKFFVLNRTMAFVWRRCDGAHTLGRMVDALAEEFSDVPPATAEQDVRGALEELASLGLLSQTA